MRELEIAQSAGREHLIDRRRRSPTGLAPGGLDRIELHDAALQLDEPASRCRGEPFDPRKERRTEPLEILGVLRVPLTPFPEQR